MEGQNKMIFDITKLFIQEHIRVYYCKLSVKTGCVCLVLTSRSVIGSGGILQIVWTHFCLLFHERYQAVHDLLVTFDRQKTADVCFATQETKTTVFNKMKK